MDDVRRDVEVRAPIERVWALLTQPEHLRQWYAFDGAAIDLRIGGVVEHFWEDHGRYFGMIDVVERPYRLGYRYANVPDEAPAPGRSTHVLFELVALDRGRTRVVVTESGLGSLELTDDERAAYREATVQGWEGGLPALAQLARAGESDGAGVSSRGMA
jgi:uncharacterized protein YndB with AHSA1/START domain